MLLQTSAVEDGGGRENQSTSKVLFPPLLPRHPPLPFMQILRIEIEEREGGLFENCEGDDDGRLSSDSKTERRKSPRYQVGVGARSLSL